MTRDDDVALAGDDYPDLGCHGPPWRDVNGDGESGFDPVGAIRTRDELQARLDLANLAWGLAMGRAPLRPGFMDAFTVRIPCKNPKS